MVATCLSEAQAKEADEDKHIESIQTKRILDMEDKELKTSLQQSDIKFSEIRVNISEINSEVYTFKNAPIFWEIER